MAVTPAAERQRRSRAHRKGDHHLCDPSRCDGTTPVTPSQHRPPRLSARGRRLWADLGGDQLAGGRRVLAEEACRLADRLDRLDALLTGNADAWLRFTVDEGGSEVTVVVDKALSEARQQQIALKQVLAELRQAAPAAPEVPAEGSVRDQLAARRAQRLADAAGR